MPAPNVLTIDVDHWGTAAADPAAALPAAGITVRIYRKRSDGASPAIADGSAFSTDTETALTRLESLTSTTDADGIATFQLRASAPGTFYRMRIGTDPAVDFLMPDADLALTPDSIIHPADTAPALAATRFTALSDTPDELTPGQYFRVDENRNIEQVDEPSGGGGEGISAVEVEAPITGDGTTGSPIGLTLRDEDIPDGIARDSEIPTVPTELPPTDGSVTARKLASDLVLPDSAIPAGIARDSEIPTELPPTDGSVTARKLASGLVLPDSAIPAGIARDSELPTVPSTSSPWPTAPTLSESDIPAAIARDTEVTAAVSTETTARESAETALGTRIDGVATAITSEETARTDADTALGVRIDNIDTSTDDALKHQVDHLTGLTGDLTAGTASSGWSDASADAQGGYSLSQSEFSTQAEARAATVWQREGNPASSDFFVARIPADTAPENARLLLTSGEGVAFPQLLSQLQTLGTSADSAWKYYTNSFELGDDVNSLKLQLTGTAAHYGTTTYAGNLDRGKVYEQVKDILVGGTDDDTAETVTLPAAGGGSGGGGGGGSPTQPAIYTAIGSARQPIFRASASRDVNRNNLAASAFTEMIKVDIPANRLQAPTSRFYIASSFGLGFIEQMVYSLDYKWQYRQGGSGAWTDIGIWNNNFLYRNVAAGSQDNLAYTFETSYSPAADLDVSMITEFRLIMRRNGGTNWTGSGAAAGISMESRNLTVIEFPPSGGSTGPATLEQVGTFAGVSSGYVADTRTRTGISIPASMADSVALHLDVAFTDDDHRSVWFHPSDFRAATAVDPADLSGGTEFRQTVGGANAYIAHFFRDRQEIIMEYEGSDGEAPAVTVETIQAPVGPPGPPGTTDTAPDLVPFAVTPAALRYQIGTAERTNTIGIQALATSEFASGLDTNADTITLIRGNYTIILSFDARNAANGNDLYTSNDRFSIKLVADGTDVISRLITNEYLRTITNVYGGETRAIEVYVPAPTAVRFRWSYFGSDASGPYLDPSEIMIFPRGV